jgi:hypothetical protein
MFSLDYINGNTAIRIHRHDGTKMRKTRHAVLIIRDRFRVRVRLADLRLAMQQTTTNMAK